MTDEFTELPTGDALVDHAILIGQQRGKALLSEQIEVLDGLITQRRSSARAWIAAHGANDWDFELWGRKTYVLELTLAFLERLESDDEAKTFLAKRFRNAKTKAKPAGPVDRGRLPETA